MKLLPIACASLAAFLLSSCGGSPPRSTKKKEPEASSSEAVKPANPAPAPAPVVQPPPTPAAPADGEKTKSAPASGKGATDALTSEFGAGPGGKSIDAWIKDLGLADKAKVLEAIGALESAGPRAKAAVPKLTELSADKDLSEAVASALKKINK